MPLIPAAMKLNDLNKITENLAATPRMPVLFIGHGSPMNAIEDNEFSLRWKLLAKEIPQPSAVLCISAPVKIIKTFSLVVTNSQY